MTKRPRDTEVGNPLPASPALAAVKALPPTAAPKSLLGSLLAKSSKGRNAGGGRYGSGVGTTSTTTFAGKTHGGIIGVNPTSRQELPREANLYLESLLSLESGIKSGGKEEEEAAFLSFNKELFISQEWEAIRSDFYTLFQNHFQLNINENNNPVLLKHSDATTMRGSRMSRSYSDQIREPKKFWRHCREQLAKWNLSQKAREPFTTEVAARTSHYLPSGVAPTFDDQLIRDLSLKCRLASSSPCSVSAPTSEDLPHDDIGDLPVLSSQVETVRNKDIATFVELFRLDLRCQLAHDRVEQAIRNIRENARLVVEAKKGDEINDAAFVGFVQSCIALGVDVSESTTAAGTLSRIQGDEMSIQIRWTQQGTTATRPPLPSAGASSSTEAVATPQLRKLFSRFTVPLTAWRKLKLTYRGDVFCSPFGPQEEEREGEGGPPIAARRDEEEDFSLRAVTLFTRYEINLCSGSLQLCADESLKRTLEEKYNYRVADLCASPINCWSLTEGSSTVVSLQKPNVYCSAFYDTDRWFGSLGSALHLDFTQFVRTFCQGNVQWVLTLDVPYDEDLCELLFMKLAEDMRSGKLLLDGGDLGTRSPISFIGVLPLWWDLSFTHTPKVLARAEGVTCDARPNEKEKEGEVLDDLTIIKKVVGEGAAYLVEGHRIDRQWMSTLGTSDWAAFDAVFVKEGYAYYCSSTNKMLEGVTATEVLAFEDPRGRSRSQNQLQGEEGEEDEEVTAPDRRMLLSQILTAYYKVKCKGGGNDDDG